MAKGNLISGNIWEEYSQKVQNAMNAPKNMGEITEEDAKALGCKLIIADHGLRAVVMQLDYIGLLMKLLILLKILNLKALVVVRQLQVATIWQNYAKAKQ